MDLPAEPRLTPSSATDERGAWVEQGAAPGPTPDAKNVDFC
jgi:hypothetical protein